VLRNAPSLVSMVTQA